MSKTPKASSMSTGLLDSGVQTVEPAGVSEDDMLPPDGTDDRPTEIGRFSGPPSTTRTPSPAPRPPPLVPPRDALSEDEMQPEGGIDDRPTDVGRSPDPPSSPLSVGLPDLDVKLVEEADECMT